MTTPTDPSENDSEGQREALRESNQNNVLNRQINPWYAFFGICLGLPLLVWIYILTDIAMRPTSSATATTPISQSPVQQPTPATPVAIQVESKLQTNYEAINLNDTKRRVRHIMGRKPNEITHYGNIGENWEYRDGNHNKLEIEFVDKTVDMTAYLPQSGPELHNPPIDSAQQTESSPSPTPTDNNNGIALQTDYDNISVGDSESSVLQTMGRGADWQYQATDGSGATVWVFKDSTTVHFNELRVAIVDGSVSKVSYMPEDGPVTNAQVK